MRQCRFLHLLKRFQHRYHLAVKSLQISITACEVELEGLCPYAWSIIPPSEQVSCSIREEKVKGEVSVIQEISEHAVCHQQLLGRWKFTRDFRAWFTPSEKATRPISRKDLLPWCSSITSQTHLSGTFLCHLWWNKRWHISQMAVFSWRYVRVTFIWLVKAKIDTRHRAFASLRRRRTPLS